MNQAQVDLQQLRIKHILFKSKVRSVLYGGTHDAEFFSASGPLNAWFTNVGLQRYSHLTEVQTLRQVYMDLNSTATTLFTLYNSGRIEQALDGLKDIDSLSEQFATLLAALEKKLAG